MRVKEKKNEKENFRRKKTRKEIALGEWEDESAKDNNRSEARENTKK